MFAANLGWFELCVVSACLLLIYALPFWEQPFSRFFNSTTLLTLYLTENMFSFVGNKIGLLWNLDPKKQRFCLDIAKIQLNSTKYMFWFVCHKIVLFLALLSYAVFNIMFLTRGLSLSSYVNCAFDPLSYRKHVLAMKLEASSDRLQKNSDLVFLCKIPIFQPPSTQNMFWFVGNEVGLLWGLNHKKRRFCFFVAKTCCSQLYCSKNILVYLP